MATSRRRSSLSRLRALMNCTDTLEDDLVKILVIGDAAVGKTSFIQRYVSDTYNDDYKCTIGFDCVSKIVPGPRGRNDKIKLQLWDIAGQERFPLLTRSYYRYARGCIIMFDLTNAETFKNVKAWKKALACNTEENQMPIPCLLVANKVDLEGRKILHSQIDDLCQEIGAVQWTETSVKEGTNVHEAITCLLNVILDRSPKVYIPTDYEFVEAIHLKDYKEENPTRTKKSCKVCH